MNRKNIIDKINRQTDWFPKSYAGFPFGIDMQAMGLSKGSKDIAVAQRYGLVYQNYYKKDHWDWFWNYDEMLLKRNQIIQKSTKDYNFGQTFYKEWDKRYKAYVNYFEYLASQNLQKLNNKETFRNFKKLYELCTDQASYGYVVDAFLTTGEEDWLVNMITKELGTKATTKVINTLTASVFSSFVNDYELAVMELALKIKKNKKQSAAQKTQEILNKYFWIKSNYHVYKRLSREELTAEARKFIREKNLATLIERKKNAAHAHTINKQRLINKLKISRGLRNILRISELFSKIQDRRKECVLRNNTLFYEALGRLIKKQHLDKKIAFYIVHAEFFKLLKNKKINWKKVADRCNKGNLMLYYNGISSEITYNEIPKLVKLGNLFPNLSDTTELKGSPAFAGLVKGKIMVLHNTKEIAKFTAGCVLVANQTTPEFVLAMKKAVAIITDQGGITSHAAIISRELKIPCIVGVKNATKLLKDGDVVEVDAGKGIVRKI